MEPDLDELFAAAIIDPSSRPQFIAALLEADVVISGEDLGDETISVKRLVDEDGPVIPFFTSDDMLEMTARSIPDFTARPIRLPCRALWASSPGARFVLNPRSHGRVFRPDEVAALLAGVEPGRVVETVEEPRQVLIGRPSPTPERLIAVLATFFCNRPAVAEARLGWMTDLDGSAGYLMTIASSDREAALNGFGSLGIDEFTGGSPLTAIIEPDDGPASALSSIEPFYRR